ncbi:cell division protein FtsQ/DivIB [Siccirubricoccus sp. KC 17139]|uniref:Cell division protein FtsQ n=1 Tax=Siccirubricoccus soli TaxID=2899147 RepID=A0ABT1DCS1_9PROT|nr:cell division protein FtsQ/DivIB [Siccirubricoccus soli]MCO6419724.1 cell division protein FtsQ/DivIB [Siccirubricoccus soli]MCP2685859.1 cell division protein FtsQ/DivIB [Siccirubricoccus soli]
MDRSPARLRRDAREPARRARGAVTSKPPARPSRLRLWLRRRRGLARPAGLGLLGAGALLATVLAVMAADPYGRLAALWDSTADIGASAGLKVQEVVLEGSRNTPHELVREALSVRRGDPILAFDPQAARERLEMIPWVRTAHVQRLLNGTIRVKLDERNPFAIWQQDRHFSIIDREGKVVESASLGAFGPLPLVVGPRANEGAAAMIDLLRTQREVNDRVEALVRVAGRRWNLVLRNKAEVLLPEGQEEAAILRLAELQAKQALLDRPLVAIDLRLPDKLVLRLPQAAAPAGPDPALQRVRNGRG